MREAIYFCEGAEKQEAHTHGFYQGGQATGALDIPFCPLGGISVSHYAQMVNMAIIER